MSQAAWTAPDHNGPAPPPVFVVGSDRPSTALLGVMLDQHPSLAMTSGSRFIPPLWRRRQRFLHRGKLDAARLTENIARTPAFRRWRVPESTLRQRVDALSDPTFADVVQAAFAAYAETRGKPRWGDETPTYVRAMPLLSSLFPTARFVQVVRDGRDVALTMTTLLHRRSNIWREAYLWRRQTGAGLAAGRDLGPSRYLQVPYESLARSPEESLRGVCDFLDLGFDPVMLGDPASPPRPTRPAVGGSPGPDRAEEPGDWRSQMSGDQLVAFEAVAGSLLSNLGYERASPRIPLGKRIHASIVGATESARYALSSLRPSAGTAAAGTTDVTDPTS
jgi:hypothetical protein